jgi:CheY-like chemotaxis protein
MLSVAAIKSANTGNDPDLSERIVPHIGIGIGVPQRIISKRLLCHAWSPSNSARLFFVYEMRAKIVAIVDDEPSVLKSLKRLLDVSNYSTETFGSAEAFLARGDISDVSCIVLDINLGGISGIELRRRLKAMGSPIPVIFMTAFASAAVEDEVKELGYAAFLHKPFVGQLLIDCVRNAISS